MSYKEKSNESRLQEVLNCSNCPQQLKELSVSDLKWFEEFKQQFVKYVNLPVIDGYRTVRYRQPVPGARQQALVGIQSFQKEIRSYILTGNDGIPLYDDIDIQNCHPVLLAQIFELHDIPTPSFLDSYNDNREGTIAKYKFKDGKKTILTIINNSVLYINNIKKVKNFHDSLYNVLIPLLKKNPEFKTFIRTKKNPEGSFISSVLQYYENKILECMVKNIQDSGKTVGILMYDGCMVERTADDINLSELEENIKEETKFEIVLVKKPVETEWVPIVSGDSIFKKVIKEETEGDDIFDIEKLDKKIQGCYYKENDKNKVDYALFKTSVIPYINKFQCRFQSPQSYGWRQNINKPFSLGTNQSEFLIKTTRDLWLHNNDRNEYTRQVFIIEDDKVPVNERVYNLYTRPTKKSGETPQIFLDFLKEVICNNDEEVFKYMVQYIHVLIKTGKTKQCVVLMGNKGTGKSTLIDILSDLVGKEYYTPVNDIQRLTSNFNSVYEKTILIGIEEVVSSAGDYHKVQNTLKSLITEDFKTIEKKGIDSYNIECSNNYIISTNGSNPVQITDDNRRYPILEVSECRRGDREYFETLRKYTDSHIEEIRDYFYNLEYTTDLASNRPTTKKELELKELNMSPIDRFLRDEMNVSIDYLYSDMYNVYVDYCKEIGENKASSKYFANALKKAGYTTIRKGKSKHTYIQPLETLDR